MKLTRQFVIIREIYRQYTAFKKFSKLSPEQRAESDIPSKLPLALIRLGPTFIKLGQILSTRADMLPMKYIESLEILQENVPPFPFKEVKTIFKEEFEKDISELYRNFDEAPAASASLAQVHFAVLPTGEEVAVKVQRPDVQERITNDLETLDSLLRFAALIVPNTMKRSNLRAAFDEFRRYTLQELDFVLEARTMGRFVANFNGWEDVVIPNVYWTHTSSRVLTMQKLSGMRLAEAMKAFSQEQKQKIVKRLMEMEMKMFISDGLFHADLHPGNILFLEDGSLAVLDFGMFGELSEEEIDHFTLYWLAVVQKQVKRAFYHFTQMTNRLPQADETAFFEKFNSLAQRFYTSRLSEMTITQVYFEMIAAGFKYGFVFPSHLMLHAKAITTAEALAFTLAPEIKAEKLTKDAVRKEFAKRASDMQRLTFRIGQVIPELLLTGEILPSSARDVYDPRLDSSFMAMGLFDILSAIAEKMKNAHDSSALPHSLIDPFARTILSEHHTEEDVQTILDDAWARYRNIEPGIPILSKPGPTINLRLAAATLAMYEALRFAGHSHGESLSIFRRISWAIYDKMGDLPLMIASAITSDPHGRMELATQMFRRFPFSSPDYVMVDVPSGENVVGFDVIKCPIAEFFKSRGMGELCRETWCELDFPLAEKWGGTLDRTATIAEGASSCDFRWKTPA